MGSTKFLRVAFLQLLGEFFASGWAAGRINVGGGFHYTSYLVSLNDKGLHMGSTKLGSFSPTSRRLFRVGLGLPAGLMLGVGFTILRTSFR